MRFGCECQCHPVCVAAFDLASRLVTSCDLMAFIADGYVHFTLQGLMDVGPNTPACRWNYLEADAVARWPGARLPTEFEWELAASATSTAWAGNFVETAACHPVPLQRAHNKQPSQFSALFGNGRSRTTARTPATDLARNWWASTTANLCATRLCCGADAGRRLIRR